eukprot:6418619-Prymnesium_polylepis.1
MHQTETRSPDGRAPTRRHSLKHTTQRTPHLRQSRATIAARRSPAVASARHDLERAPQLARGRHALPDALARVVALDRREQVGGVVLAAARVELAVEGDHAVEGARRLQRRDRAPRVGLGVVDLRRGEALDARRAARDVDPAVERGHPEEGARGRHRRDAPPLVGRRVEAVDRAPRLVLVAVAARAARRVQLAARDGDTGRVALDRERRDEAPRVGLRV